MYLHAIATAVPPAVYTQADCWNHCVLKENLTAPQTVAEAAYEALMTGERIIVPGAINNTMVAARRLIPESMQAKKNEKYYTSSGPAKRKRSRGVKEDETANLTQTNR